jgi:PKD repeat protein
VLVVGDGIYSNTVTNTEPPNVSPEVIFMSKDPVALDSVMFDYFHTLSTRQVWHQNYLHLAAQSGLGVHEHYPYAQIDYVELGGDGNIPPHAVAAADPTVGTVPLLVNFDGTGSSDADGAIVNWSWNFGDSGTGGGATTSHVYGSPNTYVATLTVTDNEGAMDADSVPITVNLPSDSDGDGLTDDDETRDLNPGTPGVQNPFDPDNPDTTGDNGHVGPDGKPDGWNDWDGDGMSNRDEFVFGYNPIDSDSWAEVPLHTLISVSALTFLALVTAGRRLAVGKRDSS